MGSFASKTWNEMSDFYNSTTPSMQTNHSIEDNINNDKRIGLYLAEDPRSPSMDIIRTPIQMVDTKHMTINCDNSGISVTDIMFDDMAIDSDKWCQHMNKLNQLLDPRSPTLGIDRTPIDLKKNESSIVVQMSAMRLSFGSNASDSLTPSQECSPIEDNSMTLTQDNEVFETNSGKKERVRTPLASVQQKQTPLNIRQRKSFNIEKRAHFNSHFLRNKLRSENDANNLMSTHVTHDKENM